MLLYITICIAELSPACFTSYIELFLVIIELIIATAISINYQYDFYITFV